MIRRFALLIATLLFGLALAGPALAHPHVFVTMQSEIVYAPDGSVTGVRHVWTFDDMYTTFATQGIEQKKKDEFSREELAPLAEVNVTSLQEYDFFSILRVDGARKKSVFAQPVYYWLEYKDSMLTLYFTLPLKTPIKAKEIGLDVYDPEYFVDFSFVEKDPVKLAGAPAQCAVALTRPNNMQFQSQRLDKSFQMSEANAGMGASFANKISVKCP